MYLEINTTVLCKLTMGASHEKYSWDPVKFTLYQTKIINQISTYLLQSTSKSTTILKDQEDTICMIPIIFFFGVLISENPDKFRKMETNY